MAQPGGNHKRKSMPWRTAWRPLVAVALALSLGLVTGCGGDDPKSNLTFKRATAKKMTIRRLIQCTGTVKAQVGAEVKVGARVSGRVERLHVRAGQPVKKNQVVAIIERAELQAKLAEAKAEMATAKARLTAILLTMPKEIAKAKAAIAERAAEARLGRIDYGRQAKLGKKGYVAGKAVDDARKTYLVAAARLNSARQQQAYLEAKMKADLATARAQVAAAEAKVKTARINLDYATIRAPITGVVGSVTTQEGETVAASLSAPTFITIIDLKRLQVDASVDETDIGAVAPGQRIRFTVDAYPNRIFKGVVRAIQPQATIQQDVVYYIVEVDIDTNYIGQLRPQMTANVLIRVGKRKGVIAVPGRAVRRLPNGTSIVIVPGNGGKPRSKPVKVGWSQGGWTEIKWGIEAGQVVLIPTRARRAGGRMRRR